jgi:putative spermidine/putrescine transport system permease protein
MATTVTIDRPVSSPGRSPARHLAALLRRRPGLGTWLLVLPGALWILVMVGIPLVTVIGFSFSTTTGTGATADFTTQNYRDLWRPGIFNMIRTTAVGTAVVLVATIVVAYPAAYFMARVLKNQRLKLALLLLCIIPFWTSYLTRMVTAIPLLGRKGVINTLLVNSGLVAEPLDIFIYSQEAMWMAMTYLWVVFMVGPIYYTLNNVDEDLVDAAKSLGARPWEIFREVLLPLSYPGVGVGALFVVILAMGEFATPDVIGGRQFPTLANGVMTEMLAIHWPAASAMAVVLVLLTLIAVVLLLRVVDVRKFL